MTIVESLNNDDHFLVSTRALNDNQHYTPIANINGSMEKKHPALVQRHQQQRAPRFGREETAQKSIFHYRRCNNNKFGERYLNFLLINILLFVTCYWTTAILDRFATRPIQTLTTMTTSSTVTQPTALFVGAWMASTSSSRPIFHIATTTKFTTAGTIRWPFFAAKKSNTNQIHMKNEKAVDLPTGTNDDFPVRNATFPKKVSVVRPAFGQVKHRPKPQSWMNKTLSSTSTPTSAPTNTKVAVQTLLPRQQQYFRPAARGTKMNSDGSITSLHTSRIQNAGRVGTKRYINPCKVYFGNLSYQITDKSTLQNYVVQQLGLPKHVLLKECNIVTDWKTNQSKGYGFVIFTEPIYATIAITKLHGTSWYNRTITVNQGVHKQNVEELQAIYQNAYRKQQLRQEEEEQNSRTPQTKSVDEIVYMDAKEAALLKHLDPDLLEGIQIIATPMHTDENENKTKKKKHETKVKQSKITMDDDDDDNDDNDNDIDYDDDDDDDDDIAYDYNDDTIYVDDIDVEIEENYEDDENDDDMMFDDDDHYIDDNDNDNKLLTSDMNDKDEKVATSKNRQQRRDGGSHCQV